MQVVVRVEMAEDAVKGMQQCLFYHSGAMRCLAPARKNRPHTRPIAAADVAVSLLATLPSQAECEAVGFWNLFPTRGPVCGMCHTVLLCRAPALHLQDQRLFWSQCRTLTGVQSNPFAA